jgi:hypothetical protein
MSPNRIQTDLAGANNFGQIIAVVASIPANINGMGRKVSP